MPTLGSTPRDRSCARAANSPRSAWSLGGRRVGGRPGGHSAVRLALRALARRLVTGRRGRGRAGLQPNDPEAQHAVHDLEAMAQAVEELVAALELEQTVLGVGVMVD